MKRGMATSRLYMSPDDMGMGLKSCVAVYLLELVRIILQYKWGTIFRSEWFWRMEELTKRNGKGVWIREIEKVLKRFDASLEWLMDRIQTRDDEIEALRQNGEIEERERDNILRTKRAKSIADVFEEVEVLIVTHFLNEFYETKSSSFLKKVIANQGSIAMNLFKKTWRTLNCTPKDDENHRGDTREPPLCWEAKGTNHKEKDGIEVLVEQNRTSAERKAHRYLRQESERRNQCPPRHRRQRPPQKISWFGEG